MDRGTSRLAPVSSNEAAPAPALALADPVGLPSTPAPAAPAAFVTPVTQSFVGRGMSVNASAGFTVSPETFLLSGEVLFDLGRGISSTPDPNTGAGFSGGLHAGGLLQLGLDDKHVLFAPAGVVRFVFDVPELPQLRPFGEAGLGFLIDTRVRKRKGKSDKRDTNINGLMLFGGGVEWMLRPNIGVGGKSYLNIAPGPGENFFLSFLGGASWYF